MHAIICDEQSSAMGVNLQVAASATISALFFLWVRNMSLATFLVVCIVPAVLYGCLAERTKPFGSIKGKTVLVTGASSGLGKAIAIEAARRGAAQVVLVARGEAALRAVAKIIGEDQATILPVDVSDTSAVRKALGTLDGRIDLLVNNAGAGAWKFTEETTPEEAGQMMAVPYQAAFTLTSLLLPALSARKGHVLNVTSIASMCGWRGGVGYGSARWAMRGFSLLLAQDAKELGVGVTLLNPAEITGTAYFSDADGKAGSSSKEKIPDLFKLVERLGLNNSTEQVAVAGLNAVEAGWSTVHVPGWLLVPSRMLADVMPAVLEALVAIGPSGLRSTKAAAAKTTKAD